MGSENVPFGDDELVLVLAVLPFVFGLFDGVMEFGDFIETVFNLLPSFVHFFLLLLQLPAMLQQSLVFLLVLEVLLCKGNFLRFDFFFQLVDLMVYNFIPSF